MLRILARYGYVVGAVGGWFWFGIGGFIYGGLGGGIIGLWMRFSLALRRGNPTIAFFARMHERALSSRPKLLESFLELLRGNFLTIKKCRAIAGAYDEAQHYLQNCESEIERKRLLRKFEHKVFLAMYGEGAVQGVSDVIEETEPLAPL